MMKILHTSDWHLGQSFFGYDRYEEHQAFLDQLHDFALSTRPDAMVVSGDIFHNYSPTTEAQRIYTEALVRLHRDMPQMEIIVAAGNHDSASKLEANRELWRLANVHVVGSLKHTADGKPDFGRHLFGIGGKGYIVALPHMFRQSYPAAPDGEDPRRLFFRQLNDYMDTVNQQGMPTVLMAHLAVEGSDTRGQRLKGYDDGIGGLDFMPAAYFGTAFDYVALGHIHRPQTLWGTHNAVRYSGSPVAVSFDEDYQHSVSVVSIEHGQKPDISYKDYEIRNIRPLLTVPAEPLPTQEAIAELARQVPPRGKFYVRLNPQESRLFPTTMEEEAVRMLESVNPEARYTTYIPNLTHAAAASRQMADYTPEQLDTMSPMEVARSYFDMQGDSDDFADYRDLLQQAIDRADKEDAQ